MSVLLTVFSSVLRNRVQKIENSDNQRLDNHDNRRLTVFIASIVYKFKPKKG